MLITNIHRITPARQYIHIYTLLTVSFHDNWVSRYQNVKPFWVLLRQDKRRRLQQCWQPEVQITCN